MTTTTNQSDTENLCLECQRKIFKTLTGKCQYCGFALPEQFLLTESEKFELLESQNLLKAEGESFARAMTNQTVTSLSGEEDGNQEANKKMKRLGIVAAAIGLIGISQ